MGTTSCSSRVIYIYPYTLTVPYWTQDYQYVRTKAGSRMLRRVLYMYMFLRCMYTGK